MNNASEEPGKKTSLRKQLIPEVCRRGSVISSWLLDLSEAARAQDHMLDGYSGQVADGSEGRWTNDVATKEVMPRFIILVALLAPYRFRIETNFRNRLPSAMRYGLYSSVEMPQ